MKKSFEDFSSGSGLPSASWQEERELFESFLSAAAVHSITVCKKIMLGTGKPKHLYPYGFFACDHCMHQDEQHPVGIVLLPKGYLLCTRCYALLESKRFNRWKELRYYCRGCLTDEIARISIISPELFKNFSNFTLTFDS